MALRKEVTMNHTRARSMLSACALTAVTAVLAASLVGSPANATEGSLSATEEQTIRTTMQDAGLTPTVEDRLIVKLQSGQKLDSELATAEPVATAITTTTNGPLTTETFADGSIRTSQTVAVPDDGPSTQVYVAHPTLECNLIHCTLIYSKADTKYMATGSFATVAAIISAACGPAAWACGIGAGIVIDMTKNAHKAGKCIALQKVMAAGPPYPVTVTCRH